MQAQAWVSGIVQARKPADAWGEIEPLLSSANPDWNGLLIESYEIRKQEPTPRLCYIDRHIVSVQRAGIVKQYEEHSVTVWYPGSIAICLIEVPQSSYSLGMRE
jgi:hypothetical protein